MRASIYILHTHILTLSPLPSPLSLSPLRLPLQGDYFFEDNAFHWIAMFNAENVGVVDEIFCFHRRGRAGQSTSMNDKKLIATEDDGGSSEKASLGGFFSNMNYIGAYLFHIFARKVTSSTKIDLDAWVARDEQRVFKPGEFRVYVDEYFCW
jgi:hypothetical protein